MCADQRKSLKILFLTSDKFPPFRVDVSVLFGQEMISRGHKIEWIMQSADSCEKSYSTTLFNSRIWVGKTDNGTSIIARFRKHIYDVIHDFILFNCLKKNKYDFIQVKDKFITAIIGIIAAKVYRKKFIYWISFPFPESSLYKAREGSARYPVLYFVRGLMLKVILYRFIMPLSYHIFVQSKQMKSDIASNGIDTNKLTAIPMGVSLHDIPYTQPNSGFKLNTFSIIYLGTLSKVRKIDFLIRVLHLVSKELENVTLYLVGDGEDQKDREILIKEAEKYGVLENIKITGFLPRLEAFRYVNSASVCVSPFYPTPILNSTSPTKLVEYMAMGRPVVANDHPEQRQVITESGGGICVPYSENEFAQAIIWILNNPSESAAMGIKGRKYVEKYRSYSKIADLLEECYYTLCLNSHR